MRLVNTMDPSNGISDYILRQQNGKELNIEIRREARE